MAGGEGVGPMRYQCQVCDARFHDVDQDYRQRLEGVCPVCGHADIRDIAPKVCRVLSVANALPQFCTQKSCASWNDYFQMCNMEIPGFSERMREVSRQLAHEATHDVKHSSIIEREVNQ